METPAWQHFASNNDNSLLEITLFPLLCCSSIHFNHIVHTCTKLVGLLQVPQCLAPRTQHLTVPMARPHWYQFHRAQKPGYRGCSRANLQDMKDAPHPPCSRGNLSGPPSISASQPPPRCCLGAHGPAEVLWLSSASEVGSPAAQSSQDCTSQPRLPGGRGLAGFQHLLLQN